MTMKLRMLILWVAAALAAGCGTPRVSSFDSRLKDWSETARVAYGEGQVARAAELYGLALERARLIDTPLEVGKTAYNLALCKAALGREEEARQFLAQALALLPAESPEVGRARMAEAELDRAGGNEPTAVATALSIVAGRAEADTKAQARVLLAEAAMRANDKDQCAAQWKRAVSALSEDSDPLVWARAEAVAAWLKQAEGGDLEAGRALERQAKWLGKAGQYRGMAGALEEATSAYRKGADLRAAADCALRAAQSLAANGEKERAVRLVLQAQGLADNAGDRERQRQAAALLAEWGIRGL